MEHRKLLGFVFDLTPHRRIETGERLPPHTVVLEPGRLFHTHRGSVAHDDLIGRPEGSIVMSSGGTAYLALRPLLFRGRCPARSG